MSIDGFDFNDALPWQLTKGMEAPVEIKFEELMDVWLVGLSQLYEIDERYDPADFKHAFLKMCSNEFDRLMQWGPACKINKSEE